MKLRSLAAALCLMALGAAAQHSGSGLNDPVTRAMMEVYDAEITANPQNYEVLFRRANEYYKFSQYLRALTDVEKALEYAPRTDTDFTYQCQLLRGEIHQMLGNHEKALDAFTQAYQLDPTSFMALYQKANSEFELGQLALAKSDYNRMRAIDPRSPEALSGLARVALKENNLGLAQQYMDDAVNMMPTDSDVYVRRASIRRLLGNNTGAVDDLLMAISINSAPRAFQELTDIANTDYPAVVTALSSAISQAPDQPMFYYIRAVIAQAHDRFPSAIADYNHIIDNNMYNYAGIYASLAECYYALTDFPLALDNVNQAIGMTRDNAEYYITQSKIYHALGRTTDATNSINRALEQLPANADALMQKGICDFAAGRYDDASTLYGSLIMDDPTAPLYYLMQGWVIYDGLQKPAQALPVYRRMLQADVDATNPRSLYGFGLLFADKKADALKWVESILRLNPDNDGSVNYMAACLYAQAGDDDSALECLEKCLSKGYSNLYNLRMRTAGRYDLAPLRSNPRFNQVLASYSYNFDY